MTEGIYPAAGAPGCRRLGSAIVALALAAAITGQLAAPAWAQSGEEQEAAGTAPSREIPRYGGRLVVAGGDPGPINPAITSSGMTHPVTGQIFNGLVRLDRKFEPQPDLAINWNVSQDQRTYTFNLDPDARWHDGRRVTSADVKYTYERVLVKFHPRTRVALGPILESISTPTSRRVVFRLKRPYAPFLRLVNEDNGAVLPRHIFKGTDPRTNPANQRPVGSGPFRFESSVPGQELTLRRNRDYFKDGRPYLDRITFRFLSGPAEVGAFEAGNVHLISPPFSEVKRLEQDPRFQVTEQGREGFSRVIRLIPNHRRRPFDDVRVRQAMTHALDRETLSRTVFGGLFEPATGPFSRGLDPYYSYDVPKYPYDPARARALLDQAGLTPDANGVRLRSEFIFDPSFRRQAQFIQKDYADVGIVLELKEMSFSDWVRKLYIEWDFDLGYSNITDPPDPDIGVKRVHTCANIVKVPFANGSGYCNPRVDALFNRAATLREEFPQKFSERGRLYREIQRILAEEQPHIFLVDGEGPYAYNAAFTGFRDAGHQATYYFGDTAWWRNGPPTRVARKVSLRMTRGGSLTAGGTVSARLFADVCASGVPVRITRNGRTVGSTVTDADGVYRLKVPQRRGRYAAVAPTTRRGGGICLRAASSRPRGGQPRFTG